MCLSNHDFSNHSLLKGGASILDKYWKKFTQKGDIFSYLEYRRKYNGITKAVQTDGSGKSRGNSDKNI
jgi:hypothetical protein